MGSKRTISVTLEGAINALAKHRDGNQVAVAGRNVFKILSIEDESNEFTEAVNMRVGKNLNLNFSCNDVVWNQLDPSLLATGATNGAVVIWNLNLSKRNKLDNVFQDHKRTVNRVCFHPSTWQLLLSGSQDGTMKLFDLRRPDASTTFLSQSESVRDVQFSPYREYCFSAVQENGNVQLWDLRRPDHYEKQFTAHSGPVFSCDWHLEESRHLATAGRDKSIKVWDVSGSRVELEHCIQTIASVARIKWRPQNRTQIASSSLVVDFNIYIWDYKRPYVPFAAFQEHKDVTTDFVWRDNGAKKLISAGKDGTVYQHVISDADHPAERINPCGIDINVRGDIFLTMSDDLLGKNLTQGRLASVDRFQQLPPTFTNSKEPTTRSSQVPDSLQLQTSAMGSRQSSLSLQSPQSAVSQQSSSSSASSSMHALSASRTNTSSTLTAAIVKRSISMFHGSSYSQAVAGGVNSSQQQQTSSQSSSSSPFVQPEIHSSQLFYLKSENLSSSLMPYDWLVSSALRYELSDQNLGELCEHNAEVAQGLKRMDVAQTWRLLRQLYVGQSMQTGGEDSDEMRNRHISGSSRHNSGNQNNSQQIVAQPAVASSANQSGNSTPGAGRTTNRKAHNNSGGSTAGAGGAAASGNATAGGSRPQVPSELKLTKGSDSEDDPIADAVLPTPTEKEFNREHPDFFFGDGDVSQNLTSFDIATNENFMPEDPTQMSMEIPREAFQVRHPLEEFWFPLDIEIINDPALNLMMIEEDEAALETVAAFKNKSQEKTKEQIKLDFNANSLLSAEMPPNPAYKFTDIVVEMLHFYAQQGDVQTAVSILLVLGDRHKPPIDTTIQEIWFHSYIDLLSRFQLWEVINKVIKLCVLPSINNLNQISTTVYTSCSNCSRQLTNKVAWLCDRCKTSSSICSVCHEVVKGVYVWCQGCSHGGHIEHMMQWLSASIYCPTGCGHICEYT